MTEKMDKRSNQKLDEIWQCNTDIGQVLCLLCKSCILVNASGQFSLKHFQDQTHVAADISQIREALKDVQLQSTDVVSRDLRRQEPVTMIAGLPVFEAYKCQLCPSWYSLNLHKSTSHVSRCHPGRPSKCKTHLEHCQVQTLMNSTKHI